MSTTDDNRQWHFDTYHPLPSDVQACGTCLIHGWEYSSVGGPDRGSGTMSEYRVELYRPVMEVAVLRVEAGSAAEARTVALADASVGLVEWERLPSDVEVVEIEEQNDE